MSSKTEHTDYGRYNCSWCGHTGDCTMDVTRGPLYHVVFICPVCFHEEPATVL